MVKHWLLQNVLAVVLFAMTSTGLAQPATTLDDSPEVTEQATEDIKMATHLTEVNIETFSNANNVWRSQQLRLESMSNDDLAMER